MMKNQEERALAIREIAKLPGKIVKEVIFPTGLGNDDVDIVIKFEDDSMLHLRSDHRSCSCRFPHDAARVYFNGETILPSSFSITKEDGAMSEENKRPAVLVVDDNEDNLFLIDTILSNAGLLVEKTASAYRALDFLKPLYHPFDLILSDLQMPEMDGLEFIKRVRQKGVKIPIVFLTAKRRDHEEAARLLHAGATAVLYKPIHETIMVSTIEAQIRQHELSMSAGREESAEGGEKS